MFNMNNVDTSTPSIGEKTIKQIELTGLTECGTFSSATESSESVNGLVGDSVMV